MGKFKNKLYSLMYGRYGTDLLNKVLLWCYLGVVLIYYVASMLIKNELAGNIVWLIYSVLTLLLIVVFFFRMFSRNIPKRRRENERFCNFFKLRRNKFRDRNTHVYRKCPKCGVTLRLPKAKGRHFVVCPRCKRRFEVKG